MKAAWIIGLLVAMATMAAEPQTLDPAAPYVWTDAPVRLAVAGEGKLTVQVKTITVDGWGPTAERVVEAVDGAIVLTPLAEGIHLVTMAGEKPQQIRFLAMAPPEGQPKLEVAPGQPYTLLSMGDSVTKTGDYETMLAMMLRRATGHADCQVVERAYPGRSVDASIRNYEQDLDGVKPDLAMIMYGLNDQGAGCSLEGYLIQNRWLKERLAKELGATVLFLTPTPDLSLPKEAETPTYGPYLFRTLLFAEALRQIEGVRVVDTFRALWGKGGPTLDAAGRAMWPLYPTHYSKPFTSLLETEGRGDGVHPNALGHLLMARAVFATLCGTPEPAPPLRFAANETVLDHRVTNVVNAVNTVNEVQRGTVTFFPMPDGELTGGGPVTYSVKPDETQSVATVAWPQLRKAADSLLAYPFSQHGCQMVAMAVDEAGHSRLEVIAAPLRGQIVSPIGGVPMGRESGWEVSLPAVGELAATTVSIPDGSVAGRLTVSRHHDLPEGAHWLVAELAYLQYAAARTGEATVDGNLDEWADALWTPLGLPEQARWTKGPEDNRPTPEDCLLHWSFKVGEQGIYLAAKVQGEIGKDSFTLFFDPRDDQALLGTPGRYYWVGGGFKDGKLRLSPGETSPNGIAGLTGVAGEGTLELFMPYALLEKTGWPASGDLGFDIWWRHVGADGARTNLLWASDGHPWSPLWWGVVRRTDEAAPELPYRVQLKQPMGVLR